MDRGETNMKYRDEDEWEDRYFDEESEDDLEYEIDEDFDPS